MDKKFIVTKDEYTANQLIADGFNLVSNIAGVWTFLNETPKNANFETFDKKKVAYSNILSI